MRDIVSPLMGLRSPFGGRVDPYKAAGFRPTLVADMTRDYYRSTSRLTFDTTFTHNALGARTMTDSDGLLKWGPHNLLTYSEQFDNAAWLKAGVSVTSNAAAAPDGAETAYRVQDTGAGTLYQGPTLPSGQTFTIAFWAKSFDGTDQTFRIYGDGSDISSDQTATADWQLYAHEFVSTGVSGTGITDGSSSGTYDILVWGAHLYRSDLGGMAPVPVDARVAGSTTYVPTTSTAKYLPRRHNHVYNGTAWVDAGTLIETEARTNLVTESQALDGTAPWNDTGNIASLSVDATGPDGLTSAVTLTDSGATGTGTVHIGYPATVATSTAYTFSIFAKADQLSWVELYTLQFTSPANGGTYFNLSAGTVGTTAAGHTATIEAVGNGWYRCAITFTSDAADTSGNLRIRLADGDGDSTVDLDGTSSILIYGAQLEAASTPSSYIPTNGAASLRSADTSGLTIPSSVAPWPTPRVVAIQMKGRATGDSYTTLRWYADANNYITQEIGTSDFTFEQAASGTVDGVTGGSFTSGVNVPFNVASYHGSTFVGGAVGGAALTANETPVALADMSSNDIGVGYDFMGNVEEVRIWVGGVTSVTTGDALAEGATA